MVEDGIYYDIHGHPFYIEKGKRRKLTEEELEEEKRRHEDWERRRYEEAKRGIGKPKEKVEEKRRQLSEEVKRRIDEEERHIWQRKRILSVLELRHRRTEAPGRPKGLDIATRNKIITALSDGPKRFGQLKQITGINPSILKRHLEWLEEETTVKRTVLRIKGHHVEYSLIGLPYTSEEIMMEFPNEPSVPYKRYLLLTPEEKEQQARQEEIDRKMRRMVDLKSFYFEYLRPWMEKEVQTPEGKTVTFDRIVPWKEALGYYRQKIGKTQQPSVEESIRNQYLPMYLFHRDLDEGRVCMPCFETGKFSVMLEEPESHIRSCAVCGHSVEVISSEVSEEGEKIERKQASYGKVSEAPIIREERLGTTPSKEEMIVLKMLNKYLKEKKEES